MHPMALRDYRIVPKGAPKQLVVMLHGVGANGEDLLDLGHVWKDVLPECVFVSPDGAEAYDMAPFGQQWFSLRDRNPEVMLEGIKKTQPIIDAYLDALLTEFSLPASKLALIGFSQGTMMSLYLAPRRAAQIAGVLGYSGALLNGEALPLEAKTKPPICLVHGVQDEVVPAAASRMAQQIFDKQGFACELHMRDHLGHSIDDGGLTLGAAFLQRILT
ncbi:MAG: phospholipase [Alphaproteobacteria bacterium]|nr:phospholipase [Alphaproteobacteria bacterium]